MRVLALCLATILMASLSATASDPDATASKLSVQEDDALLAQLLTLPFDEFVCSSRSMRRRKCFSRALQDRPDLRDIDWKVEDCADLARQLWRFQLDQSDRTYHMLLTATLRQAMKLNHIQPDKIKKIQAITTEWAKASRARVNRIRRQSGPEDEEIREKRLARKNHYNKKRKEDRKKGLGLPLLEYMKDIKDLTKLNASELHEEALKYKHKYTSVMRFLPALRNMFKVLGYRQDQVYDQNHDERNFSDPSWDCEDVQASFHGQDILERVYYLNSGTSDATRAIPASPAECYYRPKFPSDHLSPSDEYAQGDSAAGSTSWYFDDEDGYLLQPATSLHDHSDDDAFPDWDTLLPQ